QFACSLGFFASHTCQVSHRFAGLSFVALAHYADRDRSVVLPRASECARAKKFSIVRMSDDGEHSFTFEIQFHFLTSAIECRAVAPHSRQRSRSHPDATGATMRDTRRSMVHVMPAESRHSAK